MDNQKDDDQQLLEKYNSLKATIDVNNFMCPVTKQIFLKPVIANDGFIYEKWAIDGVLNCGRSKVSPITREPVSQYSESKLITNLIDQFLNDNPEFNKMRFSDSVYYNFGENISAISSHITNKNYKAISKYKEIYLNHDFKGYTFIEHVLNNCNNIKYFSKILDNCIDLNVYNNSGKLPMHYICMQGKYDIILCALEHNADIYKLNVNNDTVGHMPFIKPNKLNKEDKTSLIKYLIEKKNINLSTKDNAGNSLLYYIIKHGSIDLISYIFNNDIDLYDINKNNDSIVHIILSSDNCLQNNEKMDLISYLIQNKNIDVNKKNNNGKTILYNIFTLCTYNIILNVLEKNKDIDIYDINGKGETLLHTLLYSNGESTKNKMIMVEYLIETLNIDLNKKDNKGRILIYYICKSCTNEIISLVLEKNLSFANALNKRGDSIVHVLLNNINYNNTENTKIQLIKQLIEKNEHYLLNKNKKNITVLLLILKYEEFDSYLLEKEININNSTLFNMEIIKQLLYYKKYHFLDKFLGKISESIEIIGIENLKKSLKDSIHFNGLNPSSENLEMIVCPPLLMSKFDCCLNNLNDNNNIKSKNKKKLLMKLIDIFINVLNIIEIDNEIHNFIVMKNHEIAVQKLMVKWN